MPIEKYDYRGDINIGLYATVTEEYLVLPREFKKKDFFEQEGVETRIAGTRLIGLFTAGNSNCLLLPDSIKDREKENLEDAGLPVKILETNENALGNLILANDKGAVISEKLEDQKEEIAEALDVPVEIGEIAGIANPGSCGVASKNGVLIHREASEEEAEHVKEALKVDKVDIGTVNMGSPYIGSGIISNDEYFLVGSDTTGPEIGRIDRILMQED